MRFSHFLMKYSCLLFICCCLLLGCFFVYWLMGIILKFSSVFFPGLLLNLLWYVLNICAAECLQFEK